MIPPNNESYERAVLGTAIAIPDATAPVCDALCVDDFWSPRLREIFHAVKTLHDSKRTVDVETVAAQLGRDWKAEYGLSLLSELMDSVTHNHEAYSTELRKLTVRRKTIARCQQAISEMSDTTNDAVEQLDRLQSDVMDVGSILSSGAYVRIGECVNTEIDRLEKLQGKTNAVSGVATGYQDLDVITGGFQPTDMITLAGRPGMGKTAFAMNLARSVASHSPVGIISLEMAKEQLVRRQIASEAGIDGNGLRNGRMSRGAWDRVMDASGKLFKLPILINDDPDLTANDIRRIARKMKQADNIKLMIIDYLQLAKWQGKERELEVSKISKTFKAMAKELKIPVVALAQLNRKLEERPDKRPKLSDLRDSGSIEQDSDLVMFLYRHEMYVQQYDKEGRENEAYQRCKGKAELIIAKHRNGPTGFVPLTFIAEQTQFRSAARDM